MAQARRAGRRDQSEHVDTGQREEPQLSLLHVAASTVGLTLWLASWPAQLSFALVRNLAAGHEQVPQSRPPASLTIYSDLELESLPKRPRVASEAAPS